MRGDSQAVSNGSGPGGGPGGETDGGLIGTLLDEIEQWRRDANPQRGEQIAQFLAAVQDRWVGMALPDPADADRDQLLQWLVAGDLSRESRETRKTLACRLEVEFAQGIDFGDSGAELDEARKERLWNNVVLLLGPWFVAKVDGYFQLDPPERPDYVDRLLDTIDVWRGVDAMRPETADGPGPDGADPSGDLMSVLLGQVEQWKETAEPEDRQRTDEFLAALKARWLTRTLERLLRGGG